LGGYWQVPSMQRFVPGQSRSLLHPEVSPLHPAATVANHNPAVRNKEGFIL
jgi:hypothetical protein